MKPGEMVRFWEQLLHFIEEERVVPIVGRDVLTLNLDGRQVLLYDLLAERLAAKLGLPAEPSPASLNAVACGSRLPGPRRAAEAREPGGEGHHPAAAAAPHLADPARLPEAPAGGAGGRLQPGRPARGHRLEGRHRAGLVRPDRPCHRQAHAPRGRSGDHRVEPGRPVDRHRVEGPHGAALGRPDGLARGPAAASRERGGQRSLEPRPAGAS